MPHRILPLPFSGRVDASSYLASLFAIPGLSRWPFISTLGHIFLARRLLGCVLAFGTLSLTATIIKCARFRSRILASQRVCCDIWGEHGQRVAVRQVWRASLLIVSGTGLSGRTWYGVA